MRLKFRGRCSTRRGGCTEVSYGVGDEEQEAGLLPQGALPGRRGALARALDLLRLRREGRAGGPGGSGAACPGAPGGERPVVGQGAQGAALDVVTSRHTPGAALPRRG